MPEASNEALPGGLKKVTPRLVAAFLIITLSVLLANFLVDILYVRLDPRVRSN